MQQVALTAIARLLVLTNNGALQARLTQPGKRTGKNLLCAGGRYSHTRGT